VGVIGLGMGLNHARHYRRCPQAELIALCDLDEKRRRDAQVEFGPQVRVLPRLEELLALPDLEAVSIAVPNFLHAPLTLQALRAGKHVLCEKPLAMNAAEAAEMVRVARSLGRKLMVHFNVRFTPAVVAVKAAVDAGALGPIYYARSVWHRNRGIPGLGGWFTSRDRSGGGALIDLGVHRLDLAMYLMGLPRPVSVSGVTYSQLGARLAAREEKPFDVDDLAAAFIRFDNGAALTLETSWASNTPLREDQWTQFLGLEGGALIRNLHEGYEFEALLFRDVDGEVQQKTLPLPSDPPSAQAHFVECIREDREPSATGEQGVTVMRILDAIYESARTGAEVRLDGPSPERAPSV